MDNLKVGMKVEVHGGFRTEKPEIVVINGFGEKNGRPLFDYVDSTGNSRWAYNSQIICIVEEDLSIDHILKLSKDIPPIELILCPYCHKTAESCNCV